MTSFQYDAADRLTEKHLPNGVVSSYTYDDRDRVLSVTHTGASGVLASVTYVRSASGEPTRITREDGSYVDLTYDAALRLDTETYYNESGQVLDAIDYDYDDDGNRTRKTSLTGGVEDYSYSAGFRLDSVTKSGGTDSFGYDGAGRVTSIARDGVTRGLEYNSDDKLTHVEGGADGVPVGGVGFAAGKRGQAFGFDGSDSYVQLPNTASVPATGQFTIEAWIKPDFSVHNVWDTILTKRDGCDSSGISYLFGVSKVDANFPDEPEGLVTLSLSSDTGITRANSGTVTVPDDGNFHHVAGTFDGATAKVYLDGALVGQATHSGGIVPTSSAPVIGHHGGDCPWRANAAIDEIAFYDRALSATEIQGISQASQPRCYPGSATSCAPALQGLRHFWPADGDFRDVVGGGTDVRYQYDGVGRRVGMETSAPVVLDSVGTNHGTLVGGATRGVGRVGQGLLLDGSGYADLGNDPSLRLSQGEFSIDGFVRFDALEGDRPIIDKITGINADGFRVLKQVDGRFWVCLGAGPDTNACQSESDYALHSTTFPVVGQWYHVAFVKDVTNFSLYVNGVLEDTRALPPFIDTNSAPLILGHNNEGAYLNGGIDEVAVYPRALSAQEVATHAQIGLYDGASELTVPGATSVWRFEEVHGGSTTRYLVAPNLGDGFETPQAVTDASGNVLASYVFAGEHPLMKIEGGVATYYLQDAMGSVVGMAGASGGSSGSIKYDGFGNVTSSVGSAAGIDPNIGFDFRLHGMALDQATGLYFVRARTYDPRVGRFTSRDPIAGSTMVAETGHPYGFATSNAFRVRDPSGAFGIDDAVDALRSFATAGLPSLSYAKGLFFLHGGALSYDEEQTASERYVSFEVEPPEEANQATGPTTSIKKYGVEWLDPDFASILAHVLRDMTVLGYQPRMAWGFRVPQQEYERTIANTKTKAMPEGDVEKALRLSDPTNPRASLHLFGRAADVVDARWGWQIPLSHPYWESLASTAENYGLEAGLRWTHPDAAHIQCSNRHGSCL